MLTAMERLDERQVREAMAGAPGWTLEGNAIRRQFALGTFADAIAFVTRLAFDAEAADHHPDIQINYKRVTLIYSTHSEGGLTQKDFDGARIADAIADAMMQLSKK
jgi:4a-hydroxytetrahydrobiopterin dehydratase